MVAVNASDRNFAETFESPNGPDNQYQDEPEGLSGSSFPNGADKRYEAAIAPGNSFDPNFHSPDLPASWGTKSGLVTIGSENGGSLLREIDQVPSSNGYQFTGSFLVVADGLQEGQAVTLFAAKASDGTSIGWRLHLYKNQGELELLLVVGAGSSDSATYQLPITLNHPYDVDILYDNARRTYAWTVDGNTIVSATMPDDYPLISTKVVGSSWSSSGRNTTYAVDNASWTELSPDRVIAFPDQDGSGNQNIFLIAPDGTGRTQLTFDTTPDLLPWWSPNGTQLAYVNLDSSGVSNIWVINADGSNSHQIASQATSPAWSPSNTQIAYTGGEGTNSEIWTMSPDGSNRKQLTTTPSDLTSISPSFSPDGKRIVYVQFSPTGAVPASLWIMNADGSDQHQLTSGTWNNYDINGNIINAASSANAPAWGPNNIIAFWSGIQHQEGQIWTINPDGSDRKQLTYNLNPADEPEWSPDGTKILYTSNASGSLATWLMNSDGSGAHVLTDIAGRSSGNDAAWRPSVTGNVTIGGGAGDTIVGGTGNYFIDGHLGNQSIVGGTAGNGTIWGGAGDSIQGGAGNVTIGGVAGDTIVGGSGNYFIAADQGGQVIISGSAGNGTIWGGSGDTILGAAGNVTIGGVAGDTITGGSGNTFIDAIGGNESIAAGAGSTIVWGGSGDTVQGAGAGGNATIAFGPVHTAETYWDDGSSTSAGNDTVINFNQAIGDRVSLNSATDNASTVVASAMADGSGNAVLHLSDGSSVTLVGVTLASLNTGFFIIH